MVVLDATIVNIALPTAQQALDFSNGSRQWIVTGYALAFGSLLPLGGRIGDVFGRRRVLVLGSLGFAGASAFGGAAQSFEWLLAARVLQGAFGALLAPSALALLTTTFTEPRDRNKAFGIFGAVVGSGAAVGLLLGGALTEYLSWRWCLYVNLFLALPVTVGALMLVPGQKLPARPSLDLPGALTAAGGLFLIVFGFDRAAAEGWGAAVTIGSLVGGVALLGIFVLIEARSARPLLPLRLLEDRTRAGSYLAVLFAGVGTFGVFLFVTYFMQQTLQFSPLMSGVAFLPMIGSVIATSIGVNALLLARVGPRILVAGGMLLAAVGLVLLTRLGVDSTYASGILPSLLFVGAGLGLLFPTATNTATAGVVATESGVASSLVNVGQQVGGSLGTALLNTIATSAITAYAAGHVPASPEDGQRVGLLAQVDGYSAAFTWAAGLILLAAVVAAVLIKVNKADLPAEPVAAHVG
jgi:EmrB/QacA subfamily drug resistance transporter